MYAERVDKAYSRNRIRSSAITVTGDFDEESN